MRQLIITSFILFCGTFSFGQNKQLLYNFDGLPQTLMSNPGANISFDGHFGIPFLSQVHFSAGTTGVNLYDIFDDSSPDVTGRVTKAIRELTSKDYFTVNEQVEIISMGWRLRKDLYLSAGIYQELDMFLYFPKDPALLVNEGNSNYINVPFDFSHISFTGEILSVYHIGLNKNIDNRWTLGGRFKLYSGIFNAESTGNTGTFITRDTPEGPNYFRHYAENVDITVNTAGFASLKGRVPTVKEATTDLLKRSFFGGNPGMGVDLGASYSIDDDFTVTGAIQDLGLMFQHKDVENYRYYGDHSTDGLDPVFPFEEGGRAIPYWEIFEDEVEENLIDETFNKSYITWRPFKLNASLEYGFGYKYGPCDYLNPNNRYLINRIGVNAFAVKRPRGLNYALTTYYDRQFSERFRMRVGYTLDDFSRNNVGVLLSTRMKSFNFYLAADNIFNYFDLAKANSASIQLGLQFIFNKS